MNAARAKLFWGLMITPLAAEPVRTALTIVAVALGVAVVLAMDLAGNAATGSFPSSLETLSGEQTFEVIATGGIPEDLVGKLVLLPYDWRVTPRMEAFAVLAERDRKSTRLNSSHTVISYAVFCLKKKKTTKHNQRL